MNEDAFDSLHTGLIRVGLDGRILWLNAAAADLLARSKANLSGQALGAVEPALARWAARVDRVRPCYQAPEARLDSSGEIADIVFTYQEQDILIEMHPVAARIRRRQLAERADQQQAIHMMARQLAHELRNPLAGVRAAAQLIASQTEKPGIGRHADMIQREVDRLTRLIERFAADETPSWAPVDLHRMLEECLELVRAERHGRLKLKRDFDPSIPALRADSGRLHQLVLNLLRNAVQANASRIELSTRIEHESALIDQPARHAVRIEIRDDGRGVPVNLRERLFLPLVSGRDQGSGFGLAIAQQIARAHGGLIEYEPRDPGSAFILRLPLIISDSRQGAVVNG